MSSWDALHTLQALIAVTLGVVIFDMRGFWLSCIFAFIEKGLDVGGLLYLRRELVEVKSKSSTPRPSL